MNIMKTNEICEALDANTLIFMNDSNEDRNLSRSPSIISNESIICRICHQNESCDIESDLISPCNCSGSMAHVHQHCLQQWASIASKSICDICGYNYNCHKTFPSILMWLKDIIVGKGYTVELIITLLMAVSAILIIFATVLSSRIQLSDSNVIKSLLYILWSVTIFSWILYSVMFYYTFRFLYQSFIDWKENNLTVELVWDQSSPTVRTNCENYI